MDAMVRGDGGALHRLLGATAMLEVSVPFSLRCTTSGTVHPANGIPFTAGDRQGSPVRFDLARHLGAALHGCMGLSFISVFPLPHTDRIQPRPRRIYSSLQGIAAEIAASHTARLRNKP